jgi:hypothetical protein
MIKSLTKEVTTVQPPGGGPPADTPPPGAGGELYEELKKSEFSSKPLELFVDEDDKGGDPRN